MADIAHVIGSSYGNINARDYYKLSPDRQEPGLSFEFWNKSVAQLLTKLWLFLSSLFEIHKLDLG